MVAGQTSDAIALNALEPACLDDFLFELLNVNRHKPLSTYTVLVVVQNLGPSISAAKTHLEWRESPFKVRPFVL